MTEDFEGTASQARLFLSR